MDCWKLVVMAPERTIEGSKSSDPVPLKHPVRQNLLCKIRACTFLTELKTHLFHEHDSRIFDSLVDYGEFVRSCPSTMD